MDSFKGYQLLERYVVSDSRKDSVVSDKQCSGCVIRLQVPFVSLPLSWLVATVQADSWLGGHNMCMNKFCGE